MRNIQRIEVVDAEREKRIVTTAIVFVNCAVEQAASIEKAAKNIEGVLEANTTTGIYDLIMKVQADDEIKLQEVIKSIKNISGVTSTLTSIIYKAEDKGSSSQP